MKDNNDKNQFALALFGENRVGGKLSGIFPITEKRDDNGVLRSETVKMIKASDVAKALDINPKMKETLEANKIALKDELKKVLGKEVIGIVQSPDWTGSGATLTRDKEGNVTKLAIRFERVRKGKLILTDEQIARAWGHGMTAEMVSAMRLGQIQTLQAAQKAFEAANAAKNKEEEEKAELERMIAEEEAAKRGDTQADKAE